MFRLFICFNQKQANTRVFNHIGFSIKGGHAIGWLKYKEEEKVALMGEKLEDSLLHLIFTEDSPLGSSVPPGLKFSV